MKKQTKQELELVNVIRALNSRSEFVDIEGSKLCLQDLEALRMAAANLKDDKDIVARFCNWFYLYYRSNKGNTETYSPVGSKAIFRTLLAFDRGDILAGLISKGYTIPNNDGNLIRQAIYGGKLNIANALFECNYPVPETLSLFQIANQLNWKRDRIRTFLHIGTRIVLSKEERGVLHVVLLNSETAEEEEN